MKRPFIGAVIPAKNEEKYIENTLEAMESQVEAIVVVDDNSEDRTAELAARYTSHVIPFSGEAPSNRIRIASVINFGVSYLLENFPVDYILICGADDILDPNYVEFIIERMERDREIVIGSGHVAGQEFQPLKPRGIRIVRASWWHGYDVVPGWETKLYLEAKAKGKKIQAWKDVESHCQRSLGTKTDWKIRGKALRELGFGIPGLLNRLWQRKRYPKECFDILFGYLTHTGEPDEWLKRYHKEQHYFRSFIIKLLKRW